MEALQERSRGRYKIVEQIGEGSMGAVYLARDLECDRDVALKTLADGGSLAGADLERARRLFLHEASAGSLLSHHGVVQVYDLVDDPGGSDVYLVMEYVAGTSLAELLSRPTPMPFDFVVNVVSSVADVLDHAHAQGVVHRDVKPANILIGAGGEIKVGDFGIADLRGEDLAGDLQRAGSPNYMAPERVLSTGNDYRADIWALGVVLYEMITRRLPFQGESVAELVTRIAAEEPPPLDAHGVVVIPGLQPIVDKALAKEPDDRYQFAGAIAEELEAIQVGQSSLSATLPASSIPRVQSEELVETVAEAPLDSRPEEPSDIGGGRGWWAAVAAASSALFLLTLGMAGQIDSQSAAGHDATTEQNDPELQRQRFAYLALLEEARGMLDRGETEAAAKLFARAEGMSPDARRIRALREEAKREAERQISREVDLEVAALVGIAEADFERGALTDAADAVQRALELDPEDARALTLEIAVRQARAASERRAAERRRVVALPPPVAPSPPPARPEPMRIEQPIRPPAAAPAPTYSDLKVDFYSDHPRGVLTVYRGTSQVLRHPFRFSEKKGFLRSKGVSGGFDRQVRLPAGPSEFRVYLSLPGRETQVRRLSGILPAGAIRALQVRVDGDGTLTVELH